MKALTSRSFLPSVCLAFPEYSGVESGNETEPVTMASAGCWITPPPPALPLHYSASFKDETLIHSTCRMR